MALISNGTTIFDGGSMASGIGSSMVLIKKLTASSSATLSFVNGSSGVVLDTTYKEYMFILNNIHPATDAVNTTFQASTDGGSNYNTTMTTTFIRAAHGESGSVGNIVYGTQAQHQETNFQAEAPGNHPEFGRNFAQCQERGRARVHYFDLELTMLPWSRRRLQQGALCGMRAV